MIVDNDFIKAERAFDDDSIIEFETLTSDVDAAIISLLIEIEALRAQVEWVNVDTPEDVDFDGEVLCWDGCSYSIDYVDIDVDTSTCYMANGTEVESYKLLTPPKGD